MKMAGTPYGQQIIHNQIPQHSLLKTRAIAHEISQAIIKNKKVIPETDLVAVNSAIERVIEKERKRSNEHRRWKNIRIRQQLIKATDRLPYQYDNTYEKGFKITKRRIGNKVFKMTFLEDTIKHISKPRKKDIHKIL